MRNPSTKRLTKLAGTGTGSKLRLLAADRAFLRDLARVNLMSNEMAAKHHYSHLKGGCERSLARLEAAGLIKSKILRVPCRPTLKIYQFANSRIASAWGGALPVTGAKRNDLHELLSSHIYFAADRPADFRLAADFTANDIAAVGGYRPDALYTDSDTGELVACEANSGHYSKSQIVKKLASWKLAGINSFAWGQPARSIDRVPEIDGLKMFKF